MRTLQSLLVATAVLSLGNCAALTKSCSVTTSPVLLLPLLPLLPLQLLPPMPSQPAWCCPPCGSNCDASTA